MVIFSLFDDECFLSVTSQKYVENNSEPMMKLLIKEKDVLRKKEKKKSATDNLRYFLSST